VMRRLLIFIAALALAPAAQAQAVSVQAFADQLTVGDGDQVTFTVEVTGPFAQIGAVEPPAGRGLRLTNVRPDRSTRVSIGRGEPQQTTRLDWHFVADGVGVAEIGSAAVEVDGRRHTTQPITIRVVAAPQHVATAPDRAPRTEDGSLPDIFLTARASTASAYVGEQIVVDYVLHFRPAVQPRNARVVGAWEAPGFWREDLELRTPLPSTTVQIEGQTYEAATIRRAAFFPTRPGSLHIDALTISLDVLRAQRPGGPTGPIYNPFGARYFRQRVAAAAVPIEVRALPAGAPATFRGSAGAFALEAHADRPAAATGEGIRVTVTLSGDGNPATLEAPVWPETPGLEVFPPSREVSVPRVAPRLAATGEFTYTVVAHDPAITELPPLAWTYFDVATGRYRTLTTAPLPVAITGEATPLAALRPGREGPRLRTGPADWTRAAAPAAPFRQPGLLAAFAFPPLAVLALLLVRVGRERRRESAPLRRSRAALRGALAALRGTAPHDAAAVDAIVRDFLTARLALPARTMSVSDISASLRQRGLPDAAVADLHALLVRCQTAQFAPVAPHNSIALDAEPVLQALAAHAAEPA
jgi:hypothetical protein